MFYDTIGRLTDRNVENFSETNIPESDDFGPNSGIPEGKEYGYIHAYRKPGRGRADNHGYILTINKFHNSSSSARYILEDILNQRYLVTIHLHNLLIVVLEVS